MTAPLPSWVVSAVLEDDLLTLNRAVGIIRRRNLAMASLSLGPAARIGMSRLTCVIASDAAAVERMVNQLRKMIGVAEATAVPEAACVTREHCLVRVRVSPDRLAALLDTAELFQARVIEESPHELLLEASASPPIMVSLLRALEPFGVLEVVRGGVLAAARPAVGEAAPGRPAAATRVPAAIPA